MSSYTPPVFSSSLSFDLLSYNIHFVPDIFIIVSAFDSQITLFDLKQYQYFYFGCVVWQGILILGPGIKLAPPALEV